MIAQLFPAGRAFTCGNTVEYEASPNGVDTTIRALTTHLGRKAVAQLSIPKITGRQARELLDGITPRPWRHSIESETGETAHYVRSGDEHLAVFTGNYSGASEDGELIAAAPDLAETVAWLYERIREIHNDQRCWADAYRAPIEWDPESKDPARLARAEAHDDCADMLATLLDDEEARP